ncbi:hypothetical protein P0F02_002727 [Vibrio metschnikovii]|nr:hypothetical protein [Vibrio metschnikovii]
MRIKSFITNVFAVILVFFYIFRPQILHPLLSTALLPAAIGFVFFLLSKNTRQLLWQRTGCLFWLCLFFILSWSIIIDLSTGGISNAGARSFTISNIRFLIVSVFGGVCISLFLSEGCKFQLLKWMLNATLLQVFIGLCMLIVPEFKRFVYVNISGYTGSEKIFYDWFFYTRIFGWSEELFYLAPVFMSFILTFFYFSKSSIKVVLFYFISISIALMNARLAILGLLWGAFSRIGVLKTIKVVAVITPVIIFLVTLFFNDNPIYDLIFSEFYGGRSRTLDILIQDHLIWLGSGFEDVILGPMTYVHAGERDVTVDIGWLIIANFGGLPYLLFWTLLIATICDKSFSTVQMKLIAFCFVSLLAFKGLFFTSNSIINMLIAFSLVGGVSNEFLVKRKL